MIRSTVFGLVDEGPSRARPHTEALRAPRHVPIESTPPSRLQRDRERKRTPEARAQERRRAKARGRMA